MSECLEFPSEATAGLSFTAVVSLPSFTAPAWSATLILRGPGAIDLVAGSASGVFTFTADADTTSDWAPGQYWGVIRLSDGVDTVQVGSVKIDVAPDFASLPAGYDGRSQNEIALDAIDAVIAKRATIDQERYRINNRELYRMPVSDLLKLRTFLVAAVAREQAAKCCGTKPRRLGRAVPVRFS